MFLHCDKKNVKPQVWNTWIHRCTINQNLPTKILKRNYKKGGKFQRNF